MSAKTKDGDPPTIDLKALVKPLEVNQALTQTDKDSLGKAVPSQVNQRLSKHQPGVYPENGQGDQEMLITEQILRERLSVPFPEQGWMGAPQSDSVRRYLKTTPGDIFRTASGQMNYAQLADRSGLGPEDVLKVTEAEQARLRPPAPRPVITRQVEDAGPPPVVPRQGSMSLRRGSIQVPPDFSRQMEEAENTGKQRDDRLEASHVKQTISKFEQMMKSRPQMPKRKPPKRPDLSMQDQDMSGPST